MKIHQANLQEFFDAAGLNKNEVLKVLVLPDKHYPDYCERTHKATLDFIKDYKPHVLIALGDWWEMDPLSHWNGNLDFKELNRQLEGGIEILNELRDAAGDQLIYNAVMLGNHEVWYKRTLKRQMPEFAKFLKQRGLDLHFANISGLEANEYEVFEYNDGFELGDIVYTHGLYTNDGHGKKHVNTIGKTVIYGHTETQQTYTKIDARGVIQGISLGTQRNEEKCSFINGSPTNWVTGLGIVEYMSDGASTIYSPKITGGKFSFGGKIYG